MNLLLQFDNFCIYRVCRYEVIMDYVNVTYPNSFPLFSILWLWMRGYRTIKGTWRNGHFSTDKDEGGVGGEFL